MTAANAMQNRESLVKDFRITTQLYEDGMADLILNFKGSGKGSLEIELIAGKKKLEKVRNGELKELTAKAEATGAPEDVQAAKDCKDMCERFEKKLYDLELTRTVAMQTAPQIRLIQQNDVLMSEKIQSTLVNTIPLWKSQMTLALGINYHLLLSELLPNHKRLRAL